MKSTIMVCFLILGLIASPLQSADKEEKKVEGVVLGGDGMPLGGVEVSVWIDGTDQAVESTKTDKDGKYTLKIKGGGVYTIWYSHTKLTPTVVTYLSGRKDQNINKVMYLKGAKSLAAAYSYMESLDRAVYQASSVPPTRRERIMLAFTMKNIWPEAGIKTVSFENLKGDQADFLKAKLRMIEQSSSKLGYWK